MDTTNAKMMLGYMDDDDDEILDYDGNLDLSTDNEDEDEAESVQEYTNVPQYPETPDEKIHWQEQIRMIHLRSHLNQLMEKVRHAHYITDKTREELKKCRSQIQQYEAERDQLFTEIQTKESEGNKSAVHRVRAAHQRICAELEGEQKLEKMIIERLDQAEYELALAEVERGKFLLAEDDLLQREHKLSQEKTDAAMVRLNKEETLARQALIQKRRDDRTRHDAHMDAQRRHAQAIEEAERSHERANRYLQKTLDKLKQRENEEAERYKTDMSKKMDMLLKLKSDITHNRENLRAIRARDKAAERKDRVAEQEERDRIKLGGGNPEEVLLVKKRRNEMEKQRQQFEVEQKVKKAAIMQKILQEEENMKKRKRQQPHLWNSAGSRVEPMPQKPVKALEDYIAATTEGADDAISPEEEKEILDLLDKAEKDMPSDAADDGQSREMVADQVVPEKDTDGSESEEEYQEIVNLARPEFEGLWDKQTKPYRIPKDSELASAKPVGGSKMDQDILKKALEKTREGIVITQVAAGREFTGCPFYSKPDIIHFKDFIVGKTYKKKVTLTNVSYTVNYIKFLDITERLKDFIKIHFDPPGQMSAGLTCEMTVTFKPMINEDLEGEVSFLTQTGPFQIPLICSTKKCDLVLDTEVVDFGTTVIGETLRRSFTLTNRGALGTKFDFFKVTGMKQRTLTTAGTSLGRMTTDSMRAVSPDSGNEIDPSNKTKPAAGSSVAVDSKKKSEEALDKIPEAGEASVPPPEEPVTDGGVGTGDAQEGPIGDGTTADASDQKQEQDSEEVLSPDLAVSEMEEYGTLDGMRVGPLASGEIGPFSSLRLEIIWQPTLPGKVDPEFLVSFSDPLSDPLSIRAIANAIDVPVWVERPTVDLKICMFDRLYQDTILVNNRATTALRLKFEVCKELKNHLELLPKTGYIQAQSQFSAQLKFLPRQSLFTEAAKYFDPETGVLEAPMTIRVADQTTPVHFTVQAVVTTSDIEFDVGDIDFGYCTIHESVKRTVRLTNHSILPQQFGFIGLPEYMEVQPNDGFGTLLPLETLELDVIFSPNKTRDYNVTLVCRSLINRDFKICVRGVGVLTPLELTHQVVHFGATPLYDTASAVLHVVNSHTSSNEFTHPVPRIGKGEICPVCPTSFEFVVPKDCPVTVSPCVGTVEPGKACRIQVRFSPTLSDYDVRQEALRIHNRMEAAREEKERLEAEAREKKEAEEKTAPQGKGKNKGKTSPKGGPSAKASKLSAAASSSGSAITNEATPRFDPDKISRDSNEYLAAVTSLVRQFKGHFQSLTIPCYVASGRTGNPGTLKYSIHNTLYMEVHCPAVRPPVVVISDSGKRLVDFGDVSIGQTCPRSVTIQNISEKDLELSSTLTNPAGPFLMLNALRSLPPGGTHTVLLTFSPLQGQVFQEELGIKTFNSTLHLTLKGRGVNPLVNLNIENELFDMQPVLVSEFVERHFKIHNTSMLSIDYVIKQDSLSPLRHAKAQNVPMFLKGSNISSGITNYVGVQNHSGKNVFDIVPTKGTIPAGETKEIMVTFAPDHESDLYSDGVRLELFDQRGLPRGQEESHFFQVIGQAKPRVMFLEGADPLNPSIESLALQPAPVEEDDPAVLSDGSKSRRHMTRDGKGSVFSPPVLVTIHSVAKNDTFQPGVREIYAGCVRTMAVSQKKNGEFSVDGLQPLLQKGFTVEPQRSMIEAGTKKAIVFTWTPPPGYDPSVTVEETVTLTLKCDVTEQITLMIRAMVVSEE